MELRGARIAPTPDGKRIIAGNESTLLALDLAGTVLWRAPLPGSVSGAVLDRLTTDEHTAFLTFRPRPERSDSPGVDVLAIALD